MCTTPSPSLQSPEPTKPPLPPKRAASLSQQFCPSPPLYPRKVLEEEDCNSDTGLSSLNSSAEDTFQLDTLV